LYQIRGNREGLFLDVNIEPSVEGKYLLPFSLDLLTEKKKKNNKCLS